VRLNNGTTTVLLENVYQNTAGNGTWVHKNFGSLASMLTLTSTMRLSVELRDATPGNVAEGGLDMFRIIGNIDAGVKESLPAFGSLNAEGNPFRVSTAISYSLNDAKALAASELVVGDILGNIVERHSLDNSSGKINVGSKLSAGVYFVSLLNEQGKSKALKIVKAQ
jgi:hypothetical protein